MRITMKTTETARIKTICGDNLRESVKSGGCGNCRASCQSACKTSCTVANQPCERLNKS
ncbi:MAG: six-cysteine ranthipeptide SCIFF [Oscillospiraceae bacterium]|nr:six-cysteine ranthipeptide SCIFF [Oscillospiraceae bacterium]